MDSRVHLILHQKEMGIKHSYPPQKHLYRQGFNGSLLPAHFFDPTRSRHEKKDENETRLNKIVCKVLFFLFCDIGHQGLEASRPYLLETWAINPRRAFVPLNVQVSFGTTSGERKSYRTLSQHPFQGVRTEAGLSQPPTYPLLR